MCDNWVSGKTIKSYFDRVDYYKGEVQREQQQNIESSSGIAFVSVPRLLPPPPHAEVEGDKGARKKTGGGGLGAGDLGLEKVLLTVRYTWRVFSLAMPQFSQQSNEEIS